MKINRLFFVRILISIKELMPAFVMNAILALLPITFILTVFEIFGLLSIIPVIQILVDPSIIQENEVVSGIHRFMGSPDELYFVLYLLAVSAIFFFVKNALIYWASLRQTKLMYDTASRLTNLQFESYLYQPFGRHVAENSSIVLRKIIEIPYNFTNGIMLPLVQFINEVVIAALIITGIVVYKPVLVLSLALFIAPFLVLYVAVYKTRLKRISGEREAGHSEMFRKGRQSVDGFREILLFNKFSYFIPLFKASVSRFSNAMARIYHLNLFSPKIIETLAIFSVFGIFAVGVFLQYEVKVLVAFLATFAIAAYRLIPSVNKIIFAYNNIRSTEFVFEHLKNLKEASGRALSRDEHENVIPVQFSDQLLLDDISFSFHPEKPLLQGIRLSIHKGEMIGIMGKSGSGKSTLINIILGLYPPTAGAVKVDGVTLEKSHLRGWQNIVSFVPQNPILIEGSILENIAFGIPPGLVDKDLVEWCVEHSGLSEYVRALPNGIETFIGDKNLNISGGQKQRLAIARALYHKGSVIIFDEATSSLDTETEALLVDSIKQLCEEGYTIIMIAHRVSSLRHCNRIYSINNGQLSHPATYREIYER